MGCFTSVIIKKQYVNICKKKNIYFWYYKFPQVKKIVFPKIEYIIQILKHLNQFLFSLFLMKYNSVSPTDFLYKQLRNYLILCPSEERKSYRTDMRVNKS